MELIPKILIVGFVLWVVWSLCQPRGVFEVRVNGGIPQAVHGTVTPAFLDEVRESCERHGVERARVRGIVRGRCIALTFSRDVPPSAQQQLRN